MCSKPKKNCDGVRSCRQKSVWEEKDQRSYVKLKSHWMWTDEEDVEKSCNNRRSKSRGHQSYDSKWTVSAVSCCRGMDPLS